MLIIIQIIILMVDILDIKMKRMYNSYLSGIAYIYIGDICTGLLQVITGLREQIYRLLKGERYNSSLLPLVFMYIPLIVAVYFIYSGGIRCINIIPIFASIFSSYYQWKITDEKKLIACKFFMHILFSIYNAWSGLYILVADQGLWVIQLFREYALKYNSKE